LFVMIGSAMPRRMAVIGMALLCLVAAVRMFPDAVLATSSLTRASAVLVGSRHSLAVLPRAARPAVSRAPGRRRAFAVERTDDGRLVAHGDGLATVFSLADVEISGDSGGSVALRLGLSGIGRGSAAPAPVAKVAPSWHGSRVVYQRTGVEEWYVNGPAGLEQGFTLSTRPAGTGTLSLAVGTLAAGMTGRVSRGGSSLAVLAHGDVRRLDYGNLTVSDALGRHLRASIALESGRVLLRVADADARYPLTVDPLTQATVLTADNGVENASLGSSVAMSGTTVVANSVAGTYVYDETPSGGWQQTTELSAGGSRDAVAIDGSTIAVGGGGSLFVYTQGATGTWQQAAELAEGAGGDQFGRSLAISGNTIVAGAPETNGFEGAAYVFTKPANGSWQDATATELTAVDGAAGDDFGWSVGVSGNAVVVGAPYHHGSGTDGAMYAFTEGATGGWAGAAVAELTAGDASGGGGGLGWSVAISGDTIVGSVWGDDLAVFTAGSGGGWQGATEIGLTASGRSPSDGVSDGFGEQVALSGTSIAVGADGTSVGANAFQGSTYVFTQPPGGGWEGATQTELTLTGGAADDSLGSSVAMAGGVVVAGVPGRAVGANTDQGAVAVFTNQSASVPVSVSAPTLSGTATQGQVLTEARGTWTGSPTSYGYQWEDCDGSGSNCVPISGATTQTYTLSAADVGHTIDVQGSATNSNGTSSSAVSAASATVQAAAPPSRTAPPTISGTAINGQVLTETHGIWTNSPTSYAYQWEDCDGSGSNCVPISGATTQTYTLTAADVGHAIEVQETAANSYGPSIAASSSPTTIVRQPLPPSNVSLPRISGVDDQDQMLTESHAIWSSSPTSYTYQWEDCDGSGSNCVPISGATGQTYTLVAGDIGHTIEVQETATNAGGSSSAVSSNPTPVIAVPTPPSEVSLPTISGTPAADQMLTESHGRWSNSPTSYTYQWEDCGGSGGNCSPISGATGQTYTLVAGDIGHTIEVQETATNAGGSSGALSSNPTPVIAVPPPPANVSLPTISGVDDQDQTLTESQGSWSNSPSSYSYQWKDCDRSGANCSAIPEATGQTYTLTSADVGHTVVVFETAMNLGGSSTAAPSAATELVVVPEPPVYYMAPTVSGVLNPGQVLSESHAAWENDPTSFTYQWKDCDGSAANCVAIAGATGQTYTLTSADAGHTVVVMETASNASGAGSPSTSAATPLVKVPAAPVNVVRPRVFGTATDGQTLAESHGAWSSNPLSYAYQWEDCDSSGANCSPITGATGQSYTLRGSDVGHPIVVEEWSTNAGGTGGPATSVATEVVAASVPVNTGLPTIGGSAMLGDTLVESPGSWTASPGQFSYSWQDCDSSGSDCTEISGATGQTYTLVSSDVGHTIRVMETAMNAVGDGVPAVSAQTNQVLPLGPLSVVAPSIGGTASVGDTLSESHGGWSNDPIAYTYQWEDCDGSGNNCVGVQGATSQTYSVTGSDAGHTIEVQETAANLGGQSIPVSSAPTAIVSSKPTVTSAERVTGAGSVSLSGTVDPEGLATTAFFEYRIDPNYPGGSVSYQPAASASVGAGFASIPVSSSLTGLDPNTTYDAQLVATNGDGTETGPELTFRTASGGTPSPPTIGQTLVLAPISGIVLIKPPAASGGGTPTLTLARDIFAPRFATHITSAPDPGYVPLNDARSIHSGAKIDTRRGKLKIVAAQSGGKDPSATLAGALFKVTQASGGPHKGLTTMTLLEGAFAGAPSYDRCRGSSSSLKLQTLNAIVHDGVFQTKGRYGTATSHDATWMISDRCDGTQTRDVRGTVTITTPRGETIRLHAGQTYLAKPHH
jgi:FG-GAP repeat